MSIVEWLKQYQQEVKPYYREIFSNWQQQSQSVHPLILQMEDKFIDLYPRGKQFRGALSLLGYQLAGGKDVPAMLKASVVLELLETSTLILDDVLDEDLVRRGVSTIHQQWQQQLNVSDDRVKAKYGNDMAMLSSLMGYHLATWLFAQLSFSSHVLMPALKFYSQSCLFTVWGEVLDVNASLSPWQTRQQIAKQIHYYKTVWYTAILPMEFGAILAEKTDKQWLEILRTYCHSLGTIFQIQDDIIGSFGDPQKTGKSDNSDIVQNRWTILIELLLNRASQKDKNWLQLQLSRSDKSSADVNRVKALMKEYKVVEQAQSLAQQAMDEGAKVVQELTQDEAKQLLLQEILQFVLQRAK